MKNKRRAALIGAAALAAAAVIGGITWFMIGRKGSEPVYVYDFTMLGMTEFWGDTRQSQGSVRTDRIQNVILSDTQKVTGIKVKEGATVKKGDVLMTFDTTLSDLELEKKRLEAEKLNLELEEQKETLRKIKAMRPMVEQPPKVSYSSKYTTTLSDSYLISTKRKNDGSKKDVPMICWLRSDVAIDHNVLEACRKRAERLQSINASKDPKHPDKKVSVNAYYVIFKQTSDNTSTGQRITWQGMRVNMKKNTLAFFNASGISDFTVTDPSMQEETVDLGSGYTAAEIAKMRVEQEKAIVDTRYQIKMAKTAYKIMKAEVSDGNIYAQFDGTVISVLTENEAKEQELPIIKVSGGGGYYITGSISELDRELIQIGQEVTVQDYRSGMTYPGTIQSVSESPTSDVSYSGMTNPNASYYPFTVFVDGSANLQDDSFVEIQYTTSDSGSGIYLENPYIRTENGESYVYAMGQNGRLEKRTVVTGKRIWGSYTEIRSGLTAKDKIAFPYGKKVKPGAPTQPGDYSTLYG